MSADAPTTYVAELGGVDFRALSIDVLTAYLADIKRELSAALDAIVACTDARTYANTVAPKQRAYTLLQAKRASFDFAKNFYPSKPLRDYAAEADGELSKFFIDVEQRRDVYAAFVAYERDGFARESASLSAEQRRFFEHEMRDFRRNGLHLDDAAFVEMKKRVSDLEIEFQKNLNDENTTLVFTRAQLAGMPASWFTPAKRAEGDGDDDAASRALADDDAGARFRFTLKYPDVMPGLDYIRDEAVRRRIFMAFNNRCADTNTELFERAVVLRYHIAKRLGYATFSDYRLEVNTMKDARTAIEFEERMSKLFTPLLARELEQLHTFAQSDACADAPLAKKRFDSWDLRFYMRAYKEHVSSLDMQMVRQYFPLERVRRGMFDIYQRVLGLEFEALGDNNNRWHDDVELFRVRDAVTRDVLGFFFLDMYPREGKYSHAAAFDFVSGYDVHSLTGADADRGRRVPYVMCVVCNFPKDECLEFSDVVTFFHEFGHAMHQICSRTQLSQHCGFGVETDFVEAPSQMLEHWCYQREPLRMMSGHRDTGEPIPDDVIAKLQAQKKVLAGYHEKRQMMFGIFDLRTHMRTFASEDERFDSMAVWAEVERDVFDAERLWDLGDAHAAKRVASFGHLMGGYQSLYVSYLWAENIATAMFYKIFKENNNTLNPVAGMRYRYKILEPGSSKDAPELVRDFLAGEPDPKYLLIDKGLDADEAKKL